MSRVEKRSDDVAVVRRSAYERRRQSSWDQSISYADARRLLFVLGQLQYDATILADSYIKDGTEWYYLRFADSDHRAITSDTLWKVEQ